MSRDKADAVKELEAFLDLAIIGNKVKPRTVSKERLSNAAVLHVQATTTFYIGVVFLVLALVEPVSWKAGLVLVGFSCALTVLQRRAAKAGR